MKVKANWLVDTGSEQYRAGAQFELSDAEAERPEALGAVEVLGRKKAAKGEGEATKGEGEGGAGGADKP